MTVRWNRRYAALFFAALLLGGPLLAQDEEKATGWFDTAEFSLFMASGNAESSSIALRNTLRRVWEGASFELSAGALRAETTTASRIATGTPDDFVVGGSSETAVTAENYFLRGRYERDTVDEYYWFAGASWERNEFAGIADRTVLVGGVGTVWFDRDDTHFKTDCGLTHTRQKDVIEDPAIDDSFIGLRLSWDYGRKLTTTTEYSNLLILDGNVDESSDLSGRYGQRTEGRDEQQAGAPGESAVSVRQPASTVRDCSVHPNSIRRPRSEHDFGAARGS
jgi:putative salt-induced outer membrane protein YdiY